MNDALHQTRDLLTRTWYPFFARFGTLRPVQIEAAAPIVAGHDVLVLAATASGKTEAVAAPLLERWMADRGTSGIGVLIVSPTRALCNDLHRRLHAPVTGCKLTLDLKTGDSPGLSGARLPDVLITTPESLDSMLCRRTDQLRTVQSVMIDELHVFDSSARGDQLRCLLERLGRITYRPLQRCAASATVADADALARRFLGPDAQCVQPATAGDRQRHIEANLLSTDSFDAVATHVDELIASGAARKVLVFANSRANVELLVATLDDQPRLKGRVFAHHGNLARATRLRTERMFLDAPSAVCVATMTLELGVDIGDVDRVVLYGVPHDVSSLLQRVGRANRNQDTTRLTCAAAGNFERRRFEHLLECAAASRLFEDRVHFRPGVIAQQALSLVFQNPKGWIDAAALHSRLPPDARALWSIDDCHQILQRLVLEEHLHPMQHGRFVADGRARTRYEYGTIHGNIEEAPEIEYYEESTGRFIGRAALPDPRQMRTRVEDGQGDTQLLGGKRREIVRVRENRAFVDTQGGHDDPMFAPRQGPRYSFGLARDLARFLGYAPDALHVRVTSRTLMYGHFFGTIWSELFGYVLAGRSKLVDLNIFSAEIAFDSPGIVRPFDSPTEIRTAVRAGVEANWTRLARRFGPGPHSNLVPDALTRRWVEHNVDIEGFVTMLTALQLHDGPIFPGLDD